MILEEAVRVCAANEILHKNLIPKIVDELADESLPNAIKIEFLRTLKTKGETAEELANFAEDLLVRSIPFPIQGYWNEKPILDCCGTGGGGLNIVNISTAVMFVVASAGWPVVKHGNRGVTKNSGSADVLEALGIQVDLQVDDILKKLDKHSFAFIYAPAFHPVVKKVTSARQILAQEGSQTIFNFLGPLINPVRPAARLLGVFEKKYVDLFDSALIQMGSKYHAIAHGETNEGKSLGECSASGKTYLKGMRESKAFQNVLNKISKNDFDDLKVNNASESAQKILSAFEGGFNLVREMIILNAAVAFWIVGAVTSLEDGESLANEQINSGKVLQLLKICREK
jgi:anthranilate phosphoribosyltransferase